MPPGSLIRTAEKRSTASAENPLQDTKALMPAGD